jgi:HK97 family phage portal protein
MATLQTTDGRLLRSRRPSGASGNGFPGMFSPMWSDGSSDNTDPDAVLKSFEAIYRSQPVLAGVIDKLARRMATLPLIGYRGKPDATRKPVYGDSLDTLLRSPMPRQSTVHLLTHIFQSLLIHGNAVVAKLKPTDPEGPPTLLWPLDWSMTSAYGELGGTVEWWSTAQFGIERFIRVEDTIHFAWPAPSGSEIGVSPLEKLGVTVRLEDAAQRHQTSMFRNGIRPTAAVSIDDDNPKREKLELAREQVRAAHAGVDKGGSWVFMGANTKIQPLSFSPVEVALIDQRKLSREEIGMVFDMPGPLMGDFEHATFTNVTEMLRSLYRDIVPPWTELFVQTMQVQLLNSEPVWMDRFVRFDFSDKLKGAPEEQANVDKTDVETGIRTRDEARDGRGLPPMDGAAAELTANLNNQGLLDSLLEPDPVPEPPPVMVAPNLPVQPPAGPPVDPNSASPAANGR